MILVTGANGTVGSELVRQLRERGAPVRALVRSPEKGEALAALGAELAIGDLEDGASVDAALAGCDHAFLLIAIPPNQVEIQDAFVDACARAGIEHLVKLSAWNASDDADVAFLRWHRATERTLEASGLGWTILRPNNFFQNTLFQAGSIAADGAFYGCFGDAAVSSVDVRDIAAVAATVLTEPGHMGATLDLTGPEALTQAQMAATLTEVLGREVRYVDVPRQAVVDSMTSIGIPGYLAEDLGTLYASFGDGRAARVTTTVQDVAGRPARSFADWARDHAAAFQG